MQIDKDTYKTVPIKEQKLLLALLDDVDEINNSNPNKKIFIDRQTYHNECSPEWTDPCPDYYGYYTLRFQNDQSEIIGEKMNIHDLDSALCLLHNYIINND